MKNCDKVKKIRKIYRESPLFVQINEFHVYGIIVQQIKYLNFLYKCSNDPPWHLTHCIRFISNVVCYCCWFRCWGRKTCIFGKINEERNWKFNLNLCNSHHEIRAWKGCNFNIVVCGLQLTTHFMNKRVCVVWKTWKFLVNSPTTNRPPPNKNRNYCIFACSLFTHWLLLADYDVCKKFIIWKEKSEKISSIGKGRENPANKSRECENGNFIATKINWVSLSQLSRSLTVKSFVSCNFRLSESAHSHSPKI